jgi:hypothetical protein
MVKGRFIFQPLTKIANKYEVLKVMALKRAPVFWRGHLKVRGDTAKKGDASL